VTTTIKHWISGHEYAGASTRTAPVHNPATGAVTGQVLLAESADVEHAVATARS
jgi:malonate-semialdehyde dehydrogenase (acetylating) / methylmalonate-semialdehyde dehydrogenase